MKNSLETRLGIFFAMVFIAGLVLLELAGGFDFFRKGVEIKARFNAVNELQVGALVKLAGVPVGEVRRIAIEGNKVVVTLRVRTDAQVKTDSKAVVRFAGLMGQNYVELTFGSPARSWPSSMRPRAALATSPTCSAATTSKTCSGRSPIF
jgi:phospholipid/cholesterol/gamma-HCH transport system substrate-binding protein